MLLGACSLGMLSFSSSAAPGQCMSQNGVLLSCHSPADSLPNTWNLRNTFSFLETKHDRVSNNSMLSTAQNHNIHRLLNLYTFSTLCNLLNQHLPYSLANILNIWTWREVVQKDCQARNLNREDAMDRGKWKKLIKNWMMIRTVGG